MSLDDVPERLRRADRVAEWEYDSPGYVRDSPEVRARMLQRIMALSPEERERLKAKNRYAKRMCERFGRERVAVGLRVGLS